MECPKCHKEKPDSDFTKKSPNCKACCNAYVREWRRKNPDKQKEHQRLNRLRIEENYKLLWRLKSVPCADCKNTFHPICMDFDHKEDKTIEVSKAAANGLSQERLLAEIKKCDIVCSNCHRIRTELRRTGHLNKYHLVPTNASTS